MMEAFKTWEEMSVLEQMQCEYWDMHKDAYGVRPRCIDTSAWTEADFLAEFEHLIGVIKDNEHQRMAAEEKAEHAFVMRVLTIIACGAKDREMALRWIHEAEGSNGDDEFLCYLVGLPYRYFVKETV
jgi:hypothetical protein